MTNLKPIQGELQVRIMTAMWRLERGTVEDVRRELEPRHRGAYTTIQTVLNRLAERGLLARRREKNTIVYRPRFSEAQYLSRTIGRALSTASPGAREVALAELLGGLEKEELSELQAVARRIADQRRDRR